MSDRVRHSLQYIQWLYDQNIDRSKLDNLVRAFRGIQALPPDDPNSFFRIAGYHGLPFRGPGVRDVDWWGGYCWHASVMFPVWHRAYILRFENALRSIDGCKDVAMPFWDELVDYQAVPIPSVLTSTTFVLDGNIIHNPLYSYSLQKTLTQRVAVDDGTWNYSKLEGYETVRYPLSGLVGNDDEKSETIAHNAKFTNIKKNAEILNQNVSEWLTMVIDIPPDGAGDHFQDTHSVRSQYEMCLDAPNYTVFSNVTSEDSYNQTHPSEHVYSLETPHDAVHLAVGGFYQPGPEGYNADETLYLGANGDMGENDTASFDPIFFFHHSFIDYVFAAWQHKHKKTARGSLTIDYQYAGTTLKDLQGQPPNFPPDYKITMDTPLYPFEFENSLPGVYYTPNDVTDLSELGYSYAGGSLENVFTKSQVGSTQKVSEAQLTLEGLYSTSIVKAPPKELSAELGPLVFTKRVYNINRADYAGSFVVRLYATGYHGETIEVGRKAVLSRRNIQGCRNCQNHLDVELYVPIYQALLDHLRGPNGKDTSIGWHTEIQSHKQLQKYDFKDGAERPGPRMEHMRPNPTRSEGREVASGRPQWGGPSTFV